MSEKYLEYIRENFRDEKFAHLKKKSKLENYLYYFATKECIRLDSPTIVGLDITSKCNLKCKHCFIGERHCDNELTTSEIKNLLLTLKKMGTYQIYIMGGEPFCRKDIMEIIECIKALKMTISINTNATLITEEQCSKLSKILDEDTDWIQISIDGSNANTHNYIRNNEVFDTVINKVKLLVKHNISVRVNTVISNINISELADIYSLCASLGVKRINFNPLYPFKRDTLLSSPKSSEYIKEFEKVLDVHNELDRPIFIQQDPICIPYTVEEFGDFFEKNYEKAPALNCRAGLYSFEIDPIGNVFPCTFMHHEKFLAGNIREEDINNIWKDDKRWYSILVRRQENSQCTSCQYSSKCKGGCMAAAFDCFGDINQADPRCSLVSS